MNIYPNDSNGDVLRRLADNGFDFSIEHRVEFFSVFATEEYADEIARMYVADSYPEMTVVNIETRPHSQGGMELELVVIMYVTYENISYFENLLQERVNLVEGYLDGWGIWQD